MVMPLFQGAPSTPRQSIASARGIIAPFPRTKEAAPGQNRPETGVAGDAFRRGIILVMPSAKQTGFPDQRTAERNHVAAGVSCQTFCRLDRAHTANQQQRQTQRCLQPTSSRLVIDSVINRTLFRKTDRRTPGTSLGNSAGKFHGIQPEPLKLPANLHALRHRKTALHKIFGIDLHKYGKIVSDCAAYSKKNLFEQTHPIFQRTAIFIGPLVVERGKKFTDEISVCGMNLQPVEPAQPCTPGGRSEGVNDFLNLPATCAPAKAPFRR